MPRRLLKQLQKRMPAHGQMSKEWYLRPFNALLHDPGLWSIHRRGVTKAMAIGLFFAMLPIVGQMPLAALLALWFRVNLPVALTCTWVSNPITFVPIYYSAYKLGTVILGLPPETPVTEGFSVEWMWEELVTLWKPLYLGSGILAVVVSLLGFVTLNLIWRFTSIYRFKNRRRKAAQG